MANIGEHTVYTPVEQLVGTGKIVHGINVYGVSMVLHFMHHFFGEAIVFYVDCFRVAGLQNRQPVLLQGFFFKQTGNCRIRASALEFCQRQRVETGNQLNRCNG